MGPKYGTPGLRRRSPAEAAISARLVVLVLLVVLVTLGVHGHFPTAFWKTGSRIRDGIVAVALEAVALALIAFLWHRRRTAPPCQRVAASLRRSLLVLLSAGAVVLAAVAVMELIPGYQARLLWRQGTPVFPKPKAPLPPSGSVHLPWALIYTVTAALVLGTIIATVLWAIRHRKALPPEFSVLAEEYGSTLEEALEVGRRALLSVDDARAAIIACYVAMEESLARAGTARASAETPDELLARAARTLVVSTAAARRLTSLFYEARFSSHPLDDSRRCEAETALDELMSELGRAQPAGAGATP